MITEDTVDRPVSSPGRLGGMVICVMALHWEDVDAAWQRAVAAGAEMIYPLENVCFAASAAAGCVTRSASSG